MELQELPAPSDREAEAVDRHLRFAFEELEVAARKASAIGYGDQFMGALQEATDGIKHVRGMLR